LEAYIKKLRERKAITAGPEKDVENEIRAPGRTTRPDGYTG